MFKRRVWNLNLESMFKPRNRQNMSRSWITSHLVPATCTNHTFPGIDCKNHCWHPGWWWGDPNISHRKKISAFLFQWSRSPRCRTYMLILYIFVSDISWCPMNLYDVPVHVYSCFCWGISVPTDVVKLPVNFLRALLDLCRGLELEKHPMEHGHTTRLTVHSLMDQDHFT